MVNSRLKPGGWPVSKPPWRLVAQKAGGTENSWPFWAPAWLACALLLPPVSGRQLEVPAPGLQLAIPGFSVSSTLADPAGSPLKCVQELTAGHTHTAPPTHTLGVLTNQIQIEIPTHAL